MVVNELFDGIDIYFQRTLRLISTLVDLHWDIAQREATWEQRRLLSGLTMLAIAIGFMGMTAMMLQVFGVWLAHFLGLSWAGTILTVASLDLLLGLIFLAASLKRMNRPFMVETRRRLAKTSHVLLQERE